MRSLILQTTIFLFLYVILNSCQKETVNSDPEDLNNPPDITEFLLSPQPPLDLSNQDMIEIQVVAVDSDEDVLTYVLECSFGVLDNPVGSPDNLYTFQVNSTGNYVVKCFVSDAKSVTADSILIEVIDNRTVLPDSNLNYTDHISSLFKIKCGSEIGCHAHYNTGGQPARRLNLNIYQSTITHLIDGSEPIIVTGQGEQSFLYKILLGPLSGRSRMPKDKPQLNSNDINGVRVWIDEGAPQ
jgi:hypothetical protein